MILTQGGRLLAALDQRSITVACAVYCVASSPVVVRSDNDLASAHRRVCACKAPSRTADGRTVLAGGSPAQRAGCNMAGEAVERHAPRMEPTVLRAERQLHVHLWVAHGTEAPPHPLRG